jgi:CheY-like chemotaxis protein
MAVVAIVEDMPDNADFLRIVVENDGHVVRFFKSGTEFLAKFGPKAFDLVLLDIALGDGVDGYDVIRRIREQDSSIPVIAVTAYAYPSDIEKGLRMGFSAYITKPILNLPAFREQVYRYLNSENPLPR